MILENPVRYTLVSGIGAVIMFLGKIFIAIIAGIFTYGILVYF